MLLSKMYGAILSHFSPVLNESGANGERGKLQHIQIPSTMGVLAARLCSFQRARCKKFMQSFRERRRSVWIRYATRWATFHIIATYLWGGGSDGSSGVGSIPVVRVWGVCVVLPLSWFLSKSISLVLPRRQLVDAVVYLQPRISRRTLLIRSPDRPTRSQSPYRLRYPARVGTVQV